MLVNKNILTFLNIPKNNPLFFPLNYEHVQKVKILISPTTDISSLADSAFCILALIP